MGGARESYFPFFIPSGSPSEGKRIIFVRGNLAQFVDRPWLPACLATAEANEARIKHPWNPFHDSSKPAHGRGVIRAGVLPHMGSLPQSPKKQPEYFLSVTSRSYFHPCQKNDATISSVSPASAKSPQPSEKLAALTHQRDLLGVPRQHPACAVRNLRPEKGHKTGWWQRWKKSSQIKTETHICLLKKKNSFVRNKILNPGKIKQTTFLKIHSLLGSSSLSL